MNLEKLFPNGERLWSCSNSANSKGNVVVAGSLVAVLGSSTIQGRDLKTGEVRWESPTHAHEIFPISESRIGTRGRRAREGRWQGIDAETGEKVWKIAFEDWPPERPMTCGNEMWRLIVNEQRALTALHGVSGETGEKLPNVIAPFAESAAVSEAFFWTARHTADSIGRGLMRYDREGEDWETLSKEPHDLCFVDAEGAIVRNRKDPENRLATAFRAGESEAAWKVENNGPIAPAGDAVLVANGCEVSVIERKSGTTRCTAKFPEDKEIQEARFFGERILVRIQDESPKIVESSNGKIVGDFESLPKVEFSSGNAVVVTDEEVVVFKID